MVATLFLAWNRRVEVGKWGEGQGGWVLINSPVENSLQYNKGNWNKRESLLLILIQMTLT